MLECASQIVGFYECVFSLFLSDIVQTAFSKQTVKLFVFWFCSALEPFTKSKWLISWGHCSIRCLPNRVLLSKHKKQTIWFLCFHPSVQSYPSRVCRDIVCVLVAITMVIVYCRRRCLRHSCHHHGHRYCSVHQLLQLSPIFAVQAPFFQLLVTFLCLAW